MSSADRPTAAARTNADERCRGTKTPGATATRMPQSSANPTTSSNGSPATRRAVIAVSSASSTAASVSTRASSSAKTQPAVRRVATSASYGMVDDAPMPSVSTQITFIVVGYAALVAILALVVALRHGERPGWLDQLVWMLEALLVVRALAGLGALGGDGPPSMSTYVGYLIASVCVLPIAMQSIRDDRAVWSSAVIAVAAVAVGVIAVRLEMTA